MEPQIQRWSAKRKVELLLSLIKGERKLVDVCREHDLKQSEVEAWMETFMKAGERGLKAKSDDESAVHEKEVKELLWCPLGFCTAQATNFSRYSVGVR